MKYQIVWRNKETGYTGECATYDNQDEAQRQARRFNEEDEESVVYHVKRIKE